MSPRTSVEEQTEERSPQHTLAHRETADLEEMFEISGVVITEDWDEDPDNPHNWPSSKKWTMAAIVSLYTLVSPLASSMLAPGLLEMARHFNTTNPTLVSMILCIFVLGFAIGPLFFGPLSEIYGRTWVLHGSTAFLLIFNTVSIWAPNLTAMMWFRFLAGLGGSAAIAIGGGCIADLFRENERAAAMGIFSMGPLLGPVVGPVAGGFIVDSIGFKWIFVIVSGLTAVSMAIGIPLLRETYAPVKVPHTASLGHTLWVNLTRPMILLTRSFICFMLSLYIGVIYGYMYLMLTTFPSLFSSVYGWGPGIVGLAYLGLGVGFFLGAVFGAQWMNRIYLTLIERNGGKSKPEFRIPSMFLGSVLTPIGLFWYGWSADRGIHWIMPIIGTGIFSLGNMLTFLPIQLYLVDTFTYAASSIAAASLLRSLFGFAFPLFAGQMFEKLGTGPGNSLLGGIAIVLGIPFPLYLYFRGERMRAADKYARH